MTRVPAVERAVAILNLLTAQPGQAFRSKDIGVALGLSPATSLSILRSLTDAGFLVRTESTKTYALGPRLVAIGSVAMSLDEGYRSASTEVRALAQRFGMEALAAAAVAGKIEVIARSAPSAWRTVGIEPGDFLAPPVGLVYMSWASESTFNEWLQASRPGTESDSAIYRAAAAVVRARGYAGGLENHPDELLQIMESLAEIHDERERKASARALLSLLRHGMSFITAPVFAPDGTVPLALTLFPPDDVSTTTHRELVDALLETCGRLTAQIGGTTPPRR